MILPKHLTDRQITILELMRDGVTDEEIAKITQVSPNTIKRDIKSIYIKYGVAGIIGRNPRVAAVIMAIGYGDISISNTTLSPTAIEVRKKALQALGQHVFMTTDTTRIVRGKIVHVGPIGCVIRENKVSSGRYQWKNITSIRVEL